MSSKGSQVIYIGRQTKRPLVISPNLDALLEHDERTRPRIETPTVVSATTGSFVGLPPPPRGPRKALSPSTKAGGDREPDERVVHPALSIDPPIPPIPETSRTITGATGRTTSPSSDSAPGLTPNPFINPAPSLESLLEAEAAVRTPRIDASFSIDTTPFSPPRDEGKHQGVVDPAPSTDTAIAKPSSHTASSSTDAKKKKSKRQQVSGLSHLKVVPPLAGSRRIFATNPKPQRTTTAYDTQQQHLSSTTGYRHTEKASTAVRARNRDRLIRPKATISPPVTEIDSTVDKETRPRPLFSHENETSSQSSHSDSDSTCGPPSTAADDLRISISSTIYQPYTDAHTPYSTDGHPVIHSDHESFIEFASPSSSTFSISHPSSDTERLLPSPPIMDTSRPSSRNDMTKPTKPPLPTTPKPNFGRASPSPAAQAKKSNRNGSPPKNSGSPALDVLPPTTNLLDPEERAELIRRNRKLAQVFGKTPGGDAMAQQPTRTHLDAPINNFSHHRNAHSMNLGAGAAAGQPHTGPSTEDAPSTGAGAGDTRRHSTPLNFEDLSSWLNAFNALNTEPANLEKLAHSGPSVTSFIDLSDDDVRRWGRPREDSTVSLETNGSTAEEEQLEEDRRRKREKLAKLHRFLGSRVPTNLALGLADIETSPTSAICSDGGLMVGVDSVVETDVRIPFLRRRRSSSVAALPSSWSDDIDRLKEDLDEREKYVNVRRALKMEKVFGVQPPQTLYHTRNSPSPSLPQATGTITPTKQIFLGRAASFTPSFDRKDQSAFAKLRGKQQSETKDSDKCHSVNIQIPRKYSEVYTHYSHSLNSLHDIIDRDDKLSLAELHKYLNDETPETIQDPPPQYASALGMSSPTKAERRRSFPARTSRESLTSTISMTSPKPEVSDFQLRRRRAAKLTHFFGVDYRDLIKDVLESIEKGVDEERKQGTLDPAEAEDLLQKLRNLKTKRASTI